MPRFRKKPVEVEAVQWTGNNTDLILRWIDHTHARVQENYLVIPTLEGPHMASLNDWIIKGIKGEFYPCKPDIFLATYDRVV